MSDQGNMAQGLAHMCTDREETITANLAEVTSWSAVFKHAKYYGISRNLVGHFMMLSDHYKLFEIFNSRKHFEKHV